MHYKYKPIYNICTIYYRVFYQLTVISNNNAIELDVIIFIDIKTEIKNDFDIEGI